MQLDGMMKASIPIIQLFYGLVLMLRVGLCCLALGGFGDWLRVHRTFGRTNRFSSGS